MKAILLFLVLLNVLFFGWARWVAEPPGAGDVATPEPSAEPIVLLSEKYPERVAAEDVEAPGEAAAVADAAEVIQVEDEPVVTASLDDPPVPALSVPTVATPALPAATQSESEPASEPASEPTVEGPPPAAPARSEPEAAPELIAEPEPEPPATSIASTPPPAPSTQVAAADMRCVSIGPFSKPPRATLVADAVRGLGGTVDQRREPGRIWVGHWVHLSPAASRAAAVEVVEKLRADGVSDIYIEPSEPLRNAISLGLFSDASRAETRAGKIRQLGVRPQIRDRFRDGDRIWLDATLPEGAAFDVTRFQLGPIELGVAQRDCAAAS